MYKIKEKEYDVFERGCLSMDDLDNLIESYVSKFNSCFPTYEAIQDQTILEVRIRKCIELGMPYERLYPIEHSDDIVY